MNAVWLNDQNMDNLYNNDRKQALAAIRSASLRMRHF